jgi:hypothetical protein
MFTRRKAALVLVTATFGAALIGRATSARSEIPPQPKAFPELRAALALSDAVANRTETEIVVWSESASGNSVSSLARIEHAANAVVRGDATPDLALIYVVADEAPGDFGAVLHRVSATSPSTRLAEHVVHAARPMVDSAARVYVEVGAQGNKVEPEPSEVNPAKLRTDHLAIWAFAAGSGAHTVVTTFDGYALHLAGYTDSGPIVYRVGADRAEIVAFDVNAKRERVLATVPPFARDFSSDGRHLVYSNRHANADTQWNIDQLDLQSGVITTLTSTTDDAMTPYRLADGTTAVSGAGRSGLSFLGADHIKLRSPAGAGFDAVEDEANGILLVRHQTEAPLDTRLFVDPTRNQWRGVTWRGQFGEPLRLQGSSRGGLR